MWPLPSGLIVKALGAIAIVAGLWLWGFTVGTVRANGKIERANNAALVKRQAESAKLAETINASRETYDKAIQDLRSANSVLLISLRNRPNRRVSSPAAPSCEGSTGAELSRVDAEFLTGFANSAAEQSAALAKCNSDNEDLRNAMK